MKPTYDVTVTIGELKHIHGMSLTEIGRKLDVTGGAVSLWWNGGGMNKKNHDALWDLYMTLNNRRRERRDWSDRQRQERRELHEPAPLRLTGFGEKLKQAIADSTVPHPEPAKEGFIGNPMTSGPKDAIHLALAAAETFRSKHGLTWVIKEDGTLGAKRVITEEF